MQRVSALDLAPKTSDNIQQTALTTVDQASHIRRTTDSITNHECSNIKPTLIVNARMQQLIMSD